MYRVKLIKADGTKEYKRYRGIIEAENVAKAYVLFGKAEKAYIYVDTPDGFKQVNEILTDKGE